MQLFSTDRANRTDVERVLNRNIGEMMAQGEIRGDALDTLVNELLQTGSVVSSSKNSPWIGETYESIRSDLKGGKLYVSKDKPLVAMTGAMSAEGVDVDALFSAVSPYINEPVTLSLPVAGDFRLNRSDFEKLYRYLKGEL